jgi:hypothetical protein
MAVAQTLIAPEGDLIGWKKGEGGVIVELLIPATAKRSNATGRKCRASSAIVRNIFGAKEARSNYDPNFVYRIGETVHVPDFCEDRWQECAAGIHFFLTRIEAENY